MKRGNEGGPVGSGAGGGGKKMRGDSVTLRFLLQSKVSKSFTNPLLIIKTGCFSFIGIVLFYT